MRKVPETNQRHLKTTVWGRSAGWQRVRVSLQSAVCPAHTVSAKPEWMCLTRDEMLVTGTKRPKTRDLLGGLTVRSWGFSTPAAHCRCPGALSNTAAQAPLGSNSSSVSQRSGLWHVMLDSSGGRKAQRRLAFAKPAINLDTQQLLGTELGTSSFCRFHCNWEKDKDGERAVFSS